MNSMQHEKEYLIHLLSTVNANHMQDGKIYSQDGFDVTVLHNYHMDREEGEPWKSFSFLIEAEEKRIVYSGDIATMEDIDVLIDKCDLLLMETGHHKVEDVCNYIKYNGKKVGKLGFIHHGRAILRNPGLELEKAIRILGNNVFITEDCTTLEWNGNGVIMGNGVRLE